MRYELHPHMGDIWECFTPDVRFSITTASVVVQIRHDENADECYKFKSLLIFPMGFATVFGDYGRTTFIYG